MKLVLERHLRLAADGNAVVGRRDLLKLLPAGITAGSLTWGDTLRLQADELRRRGMACILLWMAGGPSQFETFDPKPGHANGGETKAIDTAVPGIRFAENLPKLAQVADRLAIIRSMSTREGEHQRASYLLRTSYLPLASVQHPTLGSVAAHEIADAACQLPAYVRVGGMGAGMGGGGFLGSQFDPFIVGVAGRVPENTRPMTETTRFQGRLELLGNLHVAAAPAGRKRSGEHQALYGQAARMILSPQMQAFDLEREPAAIRDAYGIGKMPAAGMQGRGGAAARGGFGLSQFASACLLARRLVESGVTFVEATIPGWDTHDDNFGRSRVLCDALDQPFAHLITDLHERGRLDKTLVVWMGEFGRTPRINGRAGRDHFPRGFSAVLAGGGIRGGRVIGATDAGGETVVDRPVSERDLFHTIYQVLGIDAKREHMTSIGRPIKFVDGGQPVAELLS